MAKMNKTDYNSQFMKMSPNMEDGRKYNVHDQQSAETLQKGGHFFPADYSNFTDDLNHSALSQE